MSRQHTQPMSRRRFLRRCAWGAAALGLMSAGCHVRPAPVLPTPIIAPTTDEGLLFYASFDQGLNADFAVGRRAARSAGARLWRVLGHGGQALAAYPGGGVAYWSEGNVLPSRGTLEAGVKLLRGFGEAPDVVHRLFTIQDAGGDNAISMETTAEDARVLRLRFQRALDDDEATELRVPAFENWRAGEWHHLALTWDVENKKETRLYLDGALKAASPLHVAPAHFDGGLMVVGSANAGVAPAFAELDDVRVFDHARTEAQVAGDAAGFNRAARAADVFSWSPGVPQRISLDLVDPPAWTFAIISDAHFTQTGAPEGPFSRSWRLPVLLQQVQLLKPSFVVHCGDMTVHSNGESEAFLSAVAECKRGHAVIGAPVHYVAGNHDIGNKRSLTMPAANLINPARIEQYRGEFGPDYYSFDVDGVHFIVLNAQLLNAEPLLEAEAQWNWLVHDLECAKDSRLLFMFMHLPLFWVDPSDPGGENYEVIDEPARSRLLQLIDEYRIAAVFAGHTHHPITSRRNGTGFWTIPSIAFARVFGKNYGVFSEATLYNEWKVGYALVRMYADRFIVTPLAGLPRAYPAAPLQGADATALKRFAPRQAEEIGDSLLGLIASPPDIVRGRWDPSYAIDDLVGANDAEEEWRGWTSASHQDPFEEEWLMVDLLETRTIEKVELLPRLKGWRFPLEFVIELSQDGATWVEAARQRRPLSPVASIPFRFPAQPARFVRFRSERMQGREPPFRVGLAELRVFGADGVNYALYGQASAKSMQEPRAVVDDRAWQLPAWTGAKWARLPARAYAWETIEALAGRYHLTPAQRRALELGRPAGVNLVMPLTTQHPRVAAPALGERFEAYVQFLASQCGPAIAAWEVRYAGQTAREFTELVERARRQVGAALLAAGTFDPSNTALVESLVGKVGAVIVSLSLNGDGAALAEQMASCRKLAERLGSPAGVWVEATLPDARATPAPEIARRMAVAFLECQRAGLRFFWGHAPASPGGLLDRMLDPEEYYYTFQTLGSLFDSSVTERALKVSVKSAAQPGAKVETATFAQPGRLLVALWLADDAGPLPLNIERHQEVEVSINIGGAGVTRVLGVDTLNGVGQDLSWSAAGGALRVAGLRLNRLPLCLVIWLAG